MPSGRMGTEVALRSVTTGDSVTHILIDGGQTGTRVRIETPDGGSDHDAPPIRTDRPVVEQIAATVRDILRTAMVRSGPDGSPGPSVVAASWDSVILDLPGYESLQRIPTMEPLRGTADHVGALFESSADATALFRAITGR